MGDNETVVCTVCGEAKPATTEFFSAVERKSNGLCSQCRACRCALRREYRRQHPELIKAQRRKSYLLNREGKLARDAEYRLANHDARCAQKRSYYVAHREEQLAKSHAYHEGHREEANAQKRRQRHANAAVVMYRKWRASHPCLVCGESNWKVVVGHHVDPKDKMAQLATVRDPSIMAAELAKCAPLCFNHHELVHDALRNGHRGNSLDAVVAHLRREATP
jgi:hypothetical protein